MSSKFLSLCEEMHPKNQSDSERVRLMQFLRSKGVKVSMVHGTDLLSIPVHEGTVTVSVSDNSEDEELEDGDIGSIDSEVEKSAKKRNDPNSMKAQRAVRDRQSTARQAVAAYSDKTRKLQTDIQNASRANVKKNTIVS